jgi:hypothetical protein
MIVAGVAFMSDMSTMWKKEPHSNPDDYDLRTRLFKRSGIQDQQNARK